MKTIFKLLLIVLLPLQVVFGAEVEWTRRLEGGSVNEPLITGHEMLLSDGEFSSLGTGSFVDARQYSYIRLGLGDGINQHYVNSRLTVTINLEITTYSNSGVASSSPINEQLSVTYYSSGFSNGVSDVTVDADDYRMQGGVYMFKVKVGTITAVKTDMNGQNPVTVTTLPDFVFLEAGIFAERYHTLDPNAEFYSTGINNITYNSSGTETVTYSVYADGLSTDELEFNWSYMPGAEYYELEWVWIDNYTDVYGSQLSNCDINLTEVDFTKNCTRIRTRDQFYRIPHIFAKGFVVYRVRAVGRWMDSPEKELFGRWSSNFSSKQFLCDWSPNFYAINNDHEKDKNWQYQATYAEDGRRKDVTQYYDGSLRGRQTVTRITSNNQSVVGETIYDNEGRGVIQMLPVPQDNPAVKFYGNLNQNAVSQPYSHHDFDWEATASCVVEGAGPVSTGSGAGKYYSSAAHTNETDWQQYVPDAEQYPFTQVEYTPDNTGRIRNQSGVGATHKIGSGHETYYYYLQPSQEELNRLFGYKVGYKSRYKKNMVVDANGQVSVSYLDAQGRVVATALSGNEGTPFNALASEQDNAHHLNMTTDLLNKANPSDADTPLDDNTPFSTGRFGALNDGLYVNTQIGVVDDGTIYAFDYKVEFSKYIENCELGEPVNFPFVYDLKLSLRDDCGSEKFTHTYTAINAVDFPTYIAQFTENVTLDRGSYTLYKEITVNEAAMQSYLSVYLDETQNACILGLNDFNFTDQEDCQETSCTECLTNLGSVDDFIASYAGLGYDDMEITAMYDQARLECQSLCQAATSCESVYAMLLSDVSPNGQYGSVTGSDPLSVYTTSGSQLPSGFNWRTPFSAYVDANGDPSVVEVTLTGVNTYSPEIVSTAVPVHISGDLYTVTPQELLHLSDFVDRFESSWAEALVAYHPEYGLYTHQQILCNEKKTVGNVNYSSDEYDDFLNRYVNTYAQAQSNITGINFTASADQIKTLDPFSQHTFTNVTLGSTNYNTIKNTLLSEAFSTTPGYKGMTNISLLRYAVKVAVYGNDYSANLSVFNSWSDVNSGNIPGLTTAQQDAIWQAYKTGYLSYKAQVKQLLSDVYGFMQSYNGKKIYNKAIGVSGVDFGGLSAFSFSSQYSAITSSIVTYWGTLPTLVDYPTAFAGSAYDSKTARFVRLDQSYDSGLGNSAILQESSSTADYGMWLSTGLCPLTLDVERLLNALAQSNRLKTSNVQMASVNELVPDLFAAINGGTYPIAGSNMTISGTASSASSLTLSFAGTLPTSSYSITMSQVGSLSWLTYNSSWFIYEISNSYPVSGTQVQVLVKAGTTLATAQEYVVTYTSNSLNLNSCQTLYASNNASDPNCDKEEQLEAAMLTLMQKLITNGTFGNTNVSLSGMTEYTGSVLVDHLGNSGAVWNGPNVSNTFSIVSGSNALAMSLSSALPSGIQSIADFSIVGTNVYMSVFASGNLHQRSGVFTYQLNGDKTSVLDLNCPCEQQDQYSENLEDHINYLLSLEPFVSPHTEPGSILITGAGALGVDYDESAGYTISGGGFNQSSIAFAMSTITPGGSLGTVSFSLNSGTTKVLNDVALIRNLVFSNAGSGSFVYNSSTGQWEYTTDGNGISFSFDVVFTDGTEWAGTGRLGAYFSRTTIAPCDDCLPTAQAPVSCNQSYATYAAAMTAKFATGLNSTDLALFQSNYLVSEATFCENGYAYITGAYVQYINSSIVSSLSDADYLTISEFGATALGYSNSNLSSAATYYVNTYVPSVADPKLTWNDFVSEVFLPLHPEMSCPPIGPSPTLPVVPAPAPCMEQDYLALVNQQTQYATYVDQMTDAFIQSYTEQAMESLVEHFSETHRSKEYHYTLYYYDRAGNLIQTVPPQGVARFEYDASNAPMTTAPTHAQINAERAANSGDLETDDWSGAASSTSAPAPDHTMETVYRYNSLNQLVYQNTPDGGESRFAYDRLGRLVMSQNAKQAAMFPERFSYTRYDALGRVIEAGEMSVSSNLNINERGRLVNASNVEYADNDGVNHVNYPDNLSTTRYEITRSIYDELRFTNVTPQDMTAPVIGGTATIQGLFGPDYSASNTRNRIVGVIYQSVYTADLNTYDNATFYDYDVHGNVKHLIQINRDANLLTINQHIKHLYYDYDLVSGKVNKVTYQKGKQDQFIHRYRYDADNRITVTETSKDDIYYEKDAKYFYYDHGPLARTEIGDKKVQAQDYAYTIQGWLKSVNGEKIDPSTMMGNDGKGGMTNTNIAKDVYGYSLSYFSGDYNSANESMLNFSENSGSNTLLGNDLYNGNIRAMHTVISNMNESTVGNSANATIAGYTHQTVYTYDQLNRIVGMSGYMAVTPGVSPAASGYSSSYSFDNNGNLLTLHRNAQDQNGVSQAMDDFVYHYDDPVNGGYNNRLSYVKDQVTGSLFGNADLDDSQTTGNYTYDNIGQLISDADEQIQSIEWTVTNKVKKVTYNGSRSGETLEFTYDAMGHRIGKKHTTPSGTDKTLYVLDAQGNPMSTYEWRGNENKLYLAERNIYGSSRLGTEMPNEEMKQELPYDYLPLNPIVMTAPELQTSTGKWFYEVPNMVGTLLDQNSDGIEDVRFSNADPNWGVFSSITTVHVQPGADYVFSFDYIDKTNVGNFLCQIWDAPSGFDYLSLTNAYLGSNEYNFTVPAGHSGQLILKWFAYKANAANDAQITLTKVRVKPKKVLEDNNKIGDKRYELSNHLGNVLNVITDRKLVDVNGTTIYNESFNSGTGGWTGLNWSGCSTLPTVSNNSGQLQFQNTCGAGIHQLFDVQPGKSYTVSFDFATSASNIYVDFHKWDYTQNQSSYGNYEYNRVATSGHYTYTFTATDKKLRLVFYTGYSNLTYTLDNFTITTHDYTADVVSYSDYEPYGMLLPNRNGSAGDDYRFGFNGMEKDDELKGNGNSYDFGARLYDPRVGRFLTTDPKSVSYPSISPYCYATNSPILFVDENGEGPIITWSLSNATKNEKTGKLTLTTTITVTRDIYIHNASSKKFTATELTDIANALDSKYSSMDFSTSLTPGDEAAMRLFMKEQYGHLSDAEIDNANIVVAINFEANVRVVNNLNAVMDPESTIYQIVDDIDAVGEVQDPNGVARLEGSACMVLADRCSPKDILNANGTVVKASKTGVHELMHMDGAKDTYLDKNGHRINGDGSIMDVGESWTLSDRTKKEIAGRYAMVAKQATQCAHKKRSSQGIGVINSTITKDGGTAKLNNTGTSENETNKSQLEGL